MIKFKTVILDGEKNKDGKHNVKIRVTHNRAVRYIRTEYYVLDKFFDKKAELILPGGGLSADDADKANLKIQIQKGLLATKMDKQTNLRFLDMVSLMEILRDRHQANDFYALIDRRISKFNAQRILVEPVIVHQFMYPIRECSAHNHRIWLMFHFA